MKKVNEVAFFVLLAVIFASIWIYPKIFDMPNIYLIDKNVITFSDGWTWKGDGYKEKFSLPYRFDIEKTEPLVIRNTLPDKLDDGSIIAMKSTAQSVVVKIDGETVYDIGNDNDKFLGRDFGDFWAFIKTKSEYEGKEIEISLFSNRAASQGAASEVFIGSESALFRHIFLQRGLWNAFAPFIIVLGLILTFGYFFFGIYKEKNRGLLYLGIYAFIMGNWFLGESEMLQLLTENAYYVTKITLLMTLVAPIPVCLYIRETVPMKKRFFDDFLITLIIINAVVSLSLEHFGILGLLDTVNVAVGLIVVVCVYYLVIFLIETIVYKNKRAMRDLKSLLVLFIFAVLEITSFFANKQTVSATYLRAGISIYILSMMLYQFNDYSERRRIRTEREHFKKMAYTDAMTGTNNRARYMEDIEKISEPEGIVVVQADTDRLKYINDFFGHVCGDKSIMDTCEVLNRNFGHMGKVYRTGGDEFAVIMKNADIDEVNATIEKTRNEIDQIAKEREYDFSVSIGAAEYDVSLDKDVYSTAVRAEHNMYEDKKRLRDTVPVKMPMTKVQ